MACIRRRRGRWVVDFRDQSGARRWESYETQKAARDALSVRLEQVRKSTHRVPTEIPTVKAVAEAWLLAARDRRPSTVAGNENFVTAHIVPRLGDRRLNQVTVADVESFRENLRSKPRPPRRTGLEPRTVNKIMTALTRIFDHAIKHGHTERNPARVIDRLKLDSGEVKLDKGGDGTGTRGRVGPADVPTAEEVTRLLDAAGAGRNRTSSWRPCTLACAKVSFSR